MSEPSEMTGLPDPQLAIHAVGMPARFSCTVKPFFLQDVGQVLRGLELLEAELGEAEHLIVHPLRCPPHAVNFEADISSCTVRASDSTGGCWARRPERVDGVRRAARQP